MGTRGPQQPGRKGASTVRVLGRLLMGAPPGPGVPWGAVVGLARGYGLSPFLYFRLCERRSRKGEEGDGVEVPEDVGKVLRQDYHAMVARRIGAERQLARILEALAAAGVPALVLKGPVLAGFYPHPALRAYGDLDLLVPEAQVGVAEEALQGLGYRDSRPKRRTAEPQRHLPPMMSDQDLLAVELHHRLDDPGRVGRLPVEDLWARAVPWSVHGQAALRLDMVDAVLYLCRHAAVQHWGCWYLRSVVDLALVTGGWGRAEWETLTRRAADWELDRAVVLMLALVEQVLGTPAPREVVAALHPDGSEPLPEDLAERLQATDGQPVARIALAMRAGLEEPLAARVRRLWCNAFQGREDMAAIYGLPAGSPRIWLAYLWRPVDLLRRYGPAAWHTLRREPTALAVWNQTAWLEQWFEGEAE